MYLSKYSPNPDANVDLSGLPENEGKPGSDSSSGSSNRVSTGAIVGIFLGAALGAALLLWTVRYSVAKRNRSEKCDPTDDSASGNNTNTNTMPSGGEASAFNSSKSLLLNHGGYQQPASSPHTVQQEYSPISKQAPQSYSNAPSGYVIDPVTRGPEVTPYAGYGNSRPEDLRTWRDHQWEMKSVGSPHRVLEPETLGSPQRWRP